MDLYVHWSVLLIAAIILLGALRQPLIALVGLSAYLSVLLIHECGHLIMAKRLGYDALRIELYPIHGLAYVEMPRSRLDVALVAWGGVMAQAVVGIPLAASAAAYGYSRFEAVNELQVILGGFSLCVAAFNLLPVAPLDGAKAWGLIPALIERSRNRRNKSARPYRSSRG